MGMLTVGDMFPDVELSIAGGGKISLPEDISGSFAYIAFYRGGW